MGRVKSRVMGKGQGKAVSNEQGNDRVWAFAGVGRG